MIRQQRLKKDFDQYKEKINKGGDNSVMAKRRASQTNEAIAKRGSIKPLFAKSISNLNVSDLEHNILHLMKVF